MNYNRKSLILSGVIALAVLVLTWLIIPIGFETNDDMSIMTLVSGAATGKPVSETMICNIIWGVIISSLYRVTDSIPWYVIVYMLLTWITMTLVCCACIRIFARSSDGPDDHKGNTMPYIIGGIAFFVLFISLFCYSSVLFQFTVMSAICGLGAIMLMQLHPEGGTGCYLLTFIMLLLADTMRQRMGYMVTVAFVFAYIVLLLLRKWPHVFYVLICSVIQAVVIIANNKYTSVVDTYGFRRFKHYLSEWINYPHDSFADNPLLYINAGWTEGVYELAENWFFLERRINTDAFISIYKGDSSSANTAATATIKTTLIGERIYSFLRQLLSSVIRLGHAIKRYRAIFIVLTVIMVLIIYILIKSRRILEALMLAASYGGTIVIMLYFQYKDRLPYRVSFPTLILFFLPTLLLIAGTVTPRLKFDKAVIKWGSMALVAGMVVFSVACSDGMANITYEGARERQEMYQVKRDMEQYAIDHRGNVYIYDVSMTYESDPFTVYSKGKPYNLICSDCFYYALPYYEQLRMNGLEELYSDKFFDDNIFFMNPDGPFDILVDYMEEEYPGCTARVISEENGFVVYRFDRGQ